MPNSTESKRECRYCKSQIHKEAIRCPKCQGDLRNWFRRHPLWTGVIIIFVLISIAAYGDESEGEPIGESNDLRGEAKFAEGHILVANHEDRDWNDCRMELNGNYNYPSKTSNWDEGEKILIEAGEVAVVRSEEFAKIDGIRFDFSEIRPQKLVVSCDNGFGYWEW